MVAIQQTTVRPMPEAEVGDVMTIVGRDGDDEITMDEMAALARHHQLRGCLRIWHAAR